MIKYFSQYNQDKFLNDNYFKNSLGGVFVDIGAHDGECFSNTLFFEKELNWTGICIEPNPDVFKILSNNRSCVCLNTAVYNKTGKILFSKNTGRTELLSGIVEKYDHKHIERINYENEVYGGSIELIDIACDTIENILTEFSVYVIDYLSIDTEGSEWDIISTIDFDKFKINILDIEINYSESDESRKIVKYLLNNNFNLVGQLGCDLIFQNHNLQFSFDNKNKE